MYEIGVMYNDCVSLRTVPTEKDRGLSDRELAALTASRVHYYSNQQGTVHQLLSLALMVNLKFRHILFTKVPRKSCLCIHDICTCTFL